MPGPLEAIVPLLVLLCLWDPVDLMVFEVPLGSPGGSDGKESDFHAGDPGSIPWSGRSPCLRILRAEEPSTLADQGTIRVSGQSYQDSQSVGILRFCVKAMPSLAESYSSSEKQLQADRMSNDGHKCLCGQSCLSACVLSEAPSQNASSNASGWMMEMVNLGLRPRESRRHKSRTDREEPHIATFF